MKFISVLVITVLITVSVGLLSKKSKSNINSNLVSPIVAGVSIDSNPTVEKQSEYRESIFGWQVFVNNYYGYKIKHPSEVNIKNKRDGDIALQKGKNINLSITQNVLSENQTINTAMEKDIDSKIKDLKEKFSLVSTISPIALGSVTAQTYSSVENSQNITYYYVPQKDKKYLLVTNLTVNVGSSDYLTSEDIIYSIELMP